MTPAIIAEVAILLHIQPRAFRLAFPVLGAGELPSNRLYKAISSLGSFSRDRNNQQVDRMCACGEIKHSGWAAHEAWLKPH